MANRPGYALISRMFCNKGLPVLKGAARNAPMSGIRHAPGYHRRLKEQLRDLEACIADEIGANSVKYNSLEGFVAALGIPEEDLCLMCFNGKSPTEEQ